MNSLVMNNCDKEYLLLCDKILQYGEERQDRTKVGTLSLHNQSLTFDLTKGFPLLTTKQVWWFGIVEELRWFISGSTNINDLDSKARHLWSPWANENGSLGPIYGENLRRLKTNKLISINHFKEIDQLRQVVESIKEFPQSRRHILSFWNVSLIEDMRLPPCHGLVVQFYIHNDNTLSCMMMQRSADVFLGLPFNIASYALLTALIGQWTSFQPRQLSIHIGDAHIYKNHVSVIKQQLQREPFPSPKLVLKDSLKYLDLSHNDIVLLDYKSHGKLKGEVAI